MVKEIYSIAIWYVNSKFYLRAYSVTTVGLGYAGNNLIHMIDQPDINKLGEKVIETLKECRQGIPHPDFKKKEKDKMLDVTGMNTDKKLMKNGKLINISLKKNLLEIRPTYFDGRAMSSSPERYLYCALDPEEITKMVLKAFEHCHP